ncbi:putative peroxisomal-coenzyme A synthetase [Aplysia californica]|uniref:Peroxisomal-coenzyme A synthetase n=1 Tax=Aplysia californica TaxID=6500 RepID=A0ABM0JGH7_APLCA|nr:putative peroxisomal-coenzyme A synthetase [Aplysia californica]XP_005093165.1 putative peroxisomal-coenzyme A synthetase [Aplysia californica]XP_005093166.1 putative peroxisomal-coenzyme A synthetase [Aplysia californica]XP_005093168.1 putative peroxisomal-coenzyme A synthetase [Aplysia californica]
MAEEIWTVAEIMKHWADTQPDAQTFRFVDKKGVQSVWTPRNIYVTSSRFASRLRGYGFSDGDVIANGIPNSPERLVTDLGIILAGCVMVNFQAVEKDGSDFWNTAKLASCKGVVIPARSEQPTHRLIAPLLPDVTKTSGCAEISVSQVPSLTKAVLVDRSESDQESSLLSSLQCSEDGVDICYNPKKSDITVLFATSGSSGFCKLVPRTNEEVLRAGRSFEGAKSIKYFSDRLFGWMGGFPFDFLAFCSPRILQDQFNGNHSTDPLELWHTIAREKSDGASILPQTAGALIEEFRDVAPDFRLTFMVTGGQPLRQYIAQAVGRLAKVMVVTYASTEAGMVSSGLVTDPFSHQDFYSGKPAKGVQIRVVDEEENDVPAGVQGDVLIKSYLLFKGYYIQGEIKPSGLFTTDGWYRTGDRGLLDAQGNFCCYGRSGDVVSVGTALVYTSWPESVLCKSPDVVDAVVTALPDADERGQLCACVITRAGSDVDEARLIDFYRNSFMSADDNSKGFYPKLHKIFFFDEFPQTSSGKLYKKKLISLIEERVRGQ